MLGFTLWYLITHAVFVKPPARMARAAVRSSQMERRPQATWQMTTLQSLPRASSNTSGDMYVSRACLQAQTWKEIAILTAIYGDAKKDI